MTDIRLSQWPQTSPVYASLGSLAVAGNCDREWLTWIRRCQFVSFFASKCLVPLVCYAMDLNVIECAVWLTIFSLERDN
jgi:hypothetical protein